MTEKKIALVTGAAGGIGTEVCRLFVNNGYKVLATHRPGKEQQAASWLQEEGLAGQDIQLLALDVADHDATATILADTLREMGHIDVLVNNAGITRDATFKKMSWDQWKEVMDTNLNSLFSVTQPVFNNMCEKGSGRIINISSVNGLKGQFGQANYSAAKAGMIGFTKALAAEGARFGVTVNVVAPGYTGTPMVTAIREDVLDSIKATIPLKRLATTEEVAGAVLYLAGEFGGYVTGETLSVNGGLYMQ
ncbi:acetoacetyl-CoA reductase [Oceanimonas baumannii]|uniref:3-oxoacyl-[acyl-carrier-protein] reductase n=1 Tax=Oceanimonas baumannii TaxID=129578 RepID=A0A235CEY8_9GAMM|nr:acetoacetyl-CoA reductase [Oceanimonas baumannii]OYD23113.1 beta-ketoacyl-ACP reductase [Oceanimonas baumannii]TDW58382.1 3-oxoacyl-[acyl-carrier-protein] reductase [Oceanimonas baumannii]